MYTRIAQYISPLVTYDQPAWGGGARPSPREMGDRLFQLSPLGLGWL